MLIEIARTCSFRPLIKRSEKRVLLNRTMGSKTYQFVGVLVLALVLFANGAAFGHGEKGDIAGSSGGGASNAVSFPSHNIEVLSHLSLSDIGGDGDEIRANDIWGWTDPETGKEYALVGRTDGVAFVDISTPREPVYLGILPKTYGSPNTIWRDLKTYRNRVYVVADNSDNGLQIFDLKELGEGGSFPKVYSESARYDGFQQAHNIAINEDSGFAYPVGASYGNGNPAWGYGLIFLDLNTEDGTPGFKSGSGYSGDGYTHDTQVVNYRGVDQRYFGAEIAFSSNEDTLTIVSLEDKGMPRFLSRTSYNEAAYVHQGWLTEDHRYFLSNDELDEIGNPSIGTTRTHIWKLEDLHSPEYVGFYDHGTVSTDHNLYIHEGLVYTANYTSGLRVLSTERIDQGILEEVAWVDTHPHEDAFGYEGAWSVYPFFESGTIIISDVNEGLVIARLALSGYTQDLDRWKESRFAEQDLADPSAESTLWGHEADPDEDELNNFMEFAFDLDPLDKDFLEYPRVGVEPILDLEGGSEENSYVTLSFLRRKDIDYLSYQLVSTQTLESPNWQEDFVFHKSEDTANEAMERVVYRSVEPVEPDRPTPPLFVRLRVSRVEPF